MHGLYLTRIVVWQVRGQKTPGAAWPQPRAGAQWEWDRGLSQTGGHVLRLVGPDF